MAAMWLMPNLLDHKNVKLAPGLLVFLCLLWILSGCSTQPLKDPIVGPNHQVRNVFQRHPLLPINVRRVAVLPVSFKEANAALVSGKESLEPVLRMELAKAARFETIYIEPTQLRQWTGREQWDAYEDLPPRMLKLLTEKTGADSILFSHLSEYKAYPPMVIGWRMKLVGSDADALWAVDEMFDAAEEAVSNAARRYDRAQVRNNPVLEDSRAILLSPTRFGHYTLQALFETLPKR
ncbi:MAG: hypothetical protein ACXW32_06305 [Limisphaerales bacterium]